MFRKNQGRAGLVILSIIIQAQCAAAAEPHNHSHDDGHQHHSHDVSLSARSAGGDTSEDMHAFHKRDARGIAPGHYLDIPLSDVPRSKTVDGIPGVATPAGLGIVYEVLDCTREGYISEGEVIEHGGPLFRNLDANRDMRLSREEFVTKYHARWAPIRHAYFDEADTDGDGLININDYMAHLERLLIVADTNKDGDTAWEEILALRSNAATPMNDGS